MVVGKRKWQFQVLARHAVAHLKLRVGAAQAENRDFRPVDDRREVSAADALIVCAYESQEKYEANHLQGAISLDELKSRESEFSKNRELIFYCA